jgi:co-chaperonin GroES (HSP10)
MKQAAIAKLSSIEALYQGREGKAHYANDKLKVRCEELGIEPPTYQPMDNNCIVWRLPPLELSKGGIVIPSDSQNPHVKGLLVAMGPRARDVLYSNGIQEGDIVIFARFAGWETYDRTHNKALGAEYLILKDRDIIGSDDLRAEMATGKAKYVLDEKTGRWNLQRKLLNGRKQKLLALAASTASPHEAETARRLAAESK